MSTCACSGACQSGNGCCGGSDGPKWTNPYHPYIVPSPVFNPYQGWPQNQGCKGCICPPGSEQTCMRSDCGRKSPPVSMPSPFVTTPYPWGTTTIYANGTGTTLTVNGTSPFTGNVTLTYSTDPDFWQAALMPKEEPPKE